MSSSWTVKCFSEKPADRQCSNFERSFYWSEGIDRDFSELGERRHDICRASTLRHVTLTSTSFVVIVVVVIINLIISTADGEASTKYRLSETRYPTRNVLTITTIMIEPYAILIDRSGTDHRRHNKRGTLSRGTPGGARRARAGASRPFADDGLNSSEDGGGLGEDELYEGYMIDLIRRIARIVGFRYRIVPALDGNFGYPQANGSWTGIIGEVMRKEADIGAGPTMITSSRLNVVDFSRAFMTMEASLLMSRATHKKFFWATTARDIVERTDIHLGTLNRGVIHRTLRKSNDTLHRRMYDIMVSGRARNDDGEGGDNKREGSGRSAWAGKSPDENIRRSDEFHDSHDESWRQDGIEVIDSFDSGIVSHVLPPTADHDSAHHYPWHSIRSPNAPPARRPTNFTETNEQGVEEARQGEYAFLLPSEIAAYVAQRRPCDVIAVDRFLVKEGLGLVVEKGSYLLQYINAAISFLRLNGELDQLYRKWWTERSQCPHQSGVVGADVPGADTVSVHARGGTDDRIVSREVAPAVSNGATSVLRLTRCRKPKVKTRKEGERSLDVGYCIVSSVAFRTVTVASLVAIIATNFTIRLTPLAPLLNALERVLLYCSAIFVKKSFCSSSPVDCQRLGSSCSHYDAKESFLPS